MRLTQTRLPRIATILVLATLAAWLLPASTTLARQNDDRNKVITQRVDDFIHYVNIAQFELAEGEANALLGMDLDPSEFLAIVEDSPTRIERFERAYHRALAVDQLEDAAADLWALFEGGKMARSRNPNEVMRNISLLTGDLRNKIYARERLIEAGEYAVPSLLEVLSSRRNDIQLQSEIQSLFMDMGRQVVAPLSAALPAMTPDVQETVCNILGAVRYPESLPALYELRSNTDAQPVRAAAARAISTIGGVENAPVAAAYRELGQRYMDGRSGPGMLSFPGEDYQLLWDYLPGIGLNATAIRTEVYHETRAMDLAKHALNIDSTDEDAVALWLAANFSREIRQPTDWENPRWPLDNLSPTYYAVAAGATAMQRVLGDALDSGDTLLARKAISALSQSAGGAGLWSGLDDRRPLLEALSYPDRRVRFESALALANANPVTPFAGSERVVPILASAIRDAGTHYAAVLASSIEDQQRLRAALEDAGYQVVRPGASLDEIESDMARVPGIDLMIIDLPEDRTVSTMETIRSSSRLRATPVIAMMDPGMMARIGRNYDADPLTRMAREGLTDEQIAANAEQLVTASSGTPMNDASAERFSLEALDALRRLAIGRNPVLRVDDAARALLASMSETDGQVRLHTAEVLSYICDKNTQVALMDAVMDDTSADQLDLFAAVTASAKRCGNMLDKRHIDWLIEQVRSDDPGVAISAATLMGALNLPTGGVVPLILETE